MTLAVEAIDLRRTFTTRSGTFRRTRKDVEAVKGVSFEIAPGELFGLLGPNGAGKTTTIKMLITLLIPTSGQANVLGHDVVNDVREVRRRIGYVFGGDRGLYERLSGLDNLRYFSELYGVAPREQKKRIGELLELVGLTGREGEKVEGYSRGMRQRLHIARGLLHDPDVFFLDEPSIGIDPVGARELRATIVGPARPGQDRAADDALHVRGRRAVRPDRGDPLRRDRRPGHPDRAQGAGQRRPGARGRDLRRHRRGRRVPRAPSAAYAPWPSRTAVRPRCSSWHANPAPRSRRRCSRSWGRPASAGSATGTHHWRMRTSNW